MKYFVGLPLIILASIPLTLLGGVVVADFWRWFVVPTFDVPAIGYLQAVGLVLTAGLFKIGLAQSESKAKSDAVGPITAASLVLIGHAAAWLISWGIGAIWSMFI